MREVPLAVRPPVGRRLTVHPRRWRGYLDRAADFRPTDATPEPHDEGDRLASGRFSDGLSWLWLFGSTASGHAGRFAVRRSPHPFSCTKRPRPREGKSVHPLSPAGNQLVQDLCQRHGVSADAATHMLIAVYNGNGTMAQFSHPEFGGSGQWMRGGMTMVSDLFNSYLKSRVDNICTDISNALANNQLIAPSGSFQSQSQSGSEFQSQSAGGGGGSNSLFLPDPESNWWPSELGGPSATGVQNNTRYAYFANSCRLAVKTGGDVWVYDTLDHRIGGFAQQQGGGSSITFSSQYGTVNLSSLPVISRNGVTQSAQPPEPTSPPEPTFQTPPDSSFSTGAAAAGGLSESANGSAPASQGIGLSESTIVPRQGEDVLATIERLGGLLDKGYITQDEFAAKKADLLNRL